MSIRSYTLPGHEHPSAMTHHTRPEFLSVMSLVSTSQHQEQSHPVTCDAKPAMMSPTTSTTSSSSLSPVGILKSPQVEHEEDSSRHQPKPTHMVRHNHVGTVSLSGVKIVSLFIDGKERLCLAQISNTLLKEYSYNEIHNRRVALGITCVQCTPVQLEILRRAGAMPISSRRCGMITKREAERLVKSFLDNTTPPKLPENFAFDVTHDCGWGCRGNFVPSRYNSSRAKCIKCTFCNMFFSPNKFIFHFHRTPESKYNHPDAANFNSWRRHLKLTSNADDELNHCWEDVKAMFNGGSRKRVLSSCTSSSSSTNSSKMSSMSSREPSKKIKYSDNTNRPPPSHPPSGTPYPQYPVFPMPNKFAPYNRPPQSHPAFGMQPPFPALSKGLVSSPQEPRMMKAPLAPWGGGLPDTICPPYEMIWAKHLGLSPVENGMVLDPRAKPFSHPPDRQVVSPSSMEKNHPHISNVQDNSYEKDKRLSAFRPVNGIDVKISPQSEPLLSPHHVTRQLSPVSAYQEQKCYASDSDDEQVDVDTIDTDDKDSEENNNNKELHQVQQLPVSNESETREIETMSPNTTASPLPLCHVAHSPVEVMRDNHALEISNQQDGLSMDEERCQSVVPEEGNNQQVYEEDSEEDSDLSSPEVSLPLVPPEESLQVLSKEELQKELMTEMKARMKLEIDCRNIKDTFQEQVEREKQFRDEMAKQLQIVRDKLCQELDQERQVRFSLQQKLKEAHEALDGFSKKSPNPPPCADRSQYKDSMLQR